MVSTPRRHLQPAPPEVTDLSDEVQFKKAEAASALRAEQRKSIAFNVLNSVHGREWLYQIIKDTHAFEDRLAMTAGEYEQGFMNGEAAVGKRLERFLASSAPELYAKMIEENLNG